MVFFSVILILKVLILIVPLLIAIAYFTLAERKIMGSIQRRRGPNVIGYLGMLQPLSDGLKLFVKETILPTSSNIGIFIFAPIWIFLLSLLGWAIIPFGKGSVLSNIDLGLFYFLAISSLGIYGIILSGWSSNSKYAFFGSLRSAAQMISYEISLGFLLVTVVLNSGSFNLSEIVLSQNKVWFFFPLLPVFLLFFISILAETNRHPFDLPEAEAELVSGYNVEYSAMGFALFFLAEYANMLLMSSICSIIFFGGWFGFFVFLTQTFWFAIKITIFVFLFCWIRAALPRYRYDHLMLLGWKTFLPISIVWLVLTASVLISFNWLP